MNGNCFLFTAMIYCCGLGLTHIQVYIIEHSMTKAILIFSPRRTIVAEEVVVIVGGGNNNNDGGVDDCDGAT